MLLLIESERLQVLYEWNLPALFVVGSVVGALLGWISHAILSLALVVGGLWLIYDGYTRWQQVRLVEDTVTEPVRSVAAGRTEVYGTCKPVEEPIDRPFSDDECVLAVWEIEEYDDGDWETIASEIRYTPFVIDDGTGAIRVEPETGMSTRISERNRKEFETGTTKWSKEPEPIREFIASREDLHQPATGLVFRKKRRYRESVIPPGEEVYVLGGAHVEEDATGSNPERLALSRHRASGEFIVSDRPQEELVDVDQRLARNEVGLGATTIGAFLAGYAYRHAGRGETGIGLAVLVIVALGIFYYGLRNWDW